MNLKHLPTIEGMLQHLVLMRLFLPLVVLSMIVIAGAGYLGVQTLITQQHQTAQSLARMVDRYLDQASRTLDAVGCIAEVSPPEGLETFMQGTWKAYGYFDTLYYLDIKSKIRRLFPPDPRYLSLDLSNLPYFQHTGEKKKLIISRPFISLRTGNPTVYLVRQLSRGGQMIGELSLGSLQDEITRNRGAGQDVIFILDQSGMLLAHPSFHLVKQQTNQGHLEIFRRGLGGEATLVYTYAETMVLGSAAQVLRAGWVVVAQVPLSVSLGPYAWALGLTLLVSLVIWLALAWSLRRRLEQQVALPLAQLSQGTGALANGDFNRGKALASLPLTFVELTMLATDFQHMSDALEAQQAQLQESEARFRAFVEKANDVIYAVSPDGVFTYVSPNWKELLGQEISEVVGQSFESFVHPDDLASCREMLNRTIVRREKVSGFEYRVQHKNGSWHWHASNASVICDADGRIVSVLGIGRNITERKLAEESMHRLNRELRAISNCNQVLVRAEDELTLLGEICRIICDEAGYRMAWVGYAENDEGKTIRPVAWAGVEEGYLAKATISWADTERGQGPAGTAVRTGESTFIQDFATNPHAAPWRESALKRVYRSCLALPLKDDQAYTFGVLIIYSSELNVFTPDEIRLLEELAGDLAFGVTVLRARTKRKQAEEALKRSEERFRRLTENARDAIYRMSLPEGTYEYMSPAIFDLCGFTPEEFYRSPQLIHQIIHPDWQGYFEEQWRRLLRGDMPPTYEFQIIHKSGEGRWVNQRNILVQDEGSRFIAIEGIATDITERKQAEAELHKLNEELEKRVAERTDNFYKKSAALKESQIALINIVEDLNEKTAELEQANIRLQELDRLKSMFIASMSHELRTPLNSIIGFSSILSEEWLGPLNAEQKKNQETVLRSGRHLLALINDVIDVSKIEAGKMETSAEVFDLYDVMVETGELFGKEASDKGLAFTVEPLHQNIRTDRRRLSQCLINLMSNAVKFTERGSVRTTARIVSVGDQEPGPTMIELTVEDTGIGIREEDLGKLFEAFVRLRTPGTISVKGTGLGLYLTRKIANELLQGEVEARSSLGKGSCFTLWIPLWEEERTNEESAGH